VVEGFMDRGSRAAFLSYVHADDAHDGGKIIKICERLSSEVRSQSGVPLHIFIDRNDIEWGETWRSRIDESLGSATLLIPIVTPSYFLSLACRDELTKFLEREKELKRRDLILPIYYIETPQFENRPSHNADALADELSTRQYVDWRHLRKVDLGSQVVDEHIERLAKLMRKALERGGQDTTEIDKEAIGQATKGSKSLTPPEARGEFEPETMPLRTFPPGELARELDMLRSGLKPGDAYLVLRHGREFDANFLINERSTVVGRDADSDIFLGDGSVSRRHAEIRRLRNRFSIRDLGSTNGTRVNGRPVEEQTLRSGDEVEIGMYRFLFLASYV
jgi:hypothetical protein